MVYDKDHQGGGKDGAEGEVWTIELVVKQKRILQ